jgi:hypothetical protein
MKIIYLNQEDILSQIGPTIENFQENIKFIQE